MNIQTILLGFLMKKSMTGYELKNAFSISFSFFSGISFGSIYPALKKMEQQGLVSMQLKIQEKAPNKKIYSITEAGKTEFHSLLKEPLQPERFKNPFLARLFFFSHLEAGDRMALSEGFLKSIREEQQRLEAAQPQVEEIADPFQKECYLFGVRIFKAYVENLDMTIENLKKIA
jgi:DNA-binding PadR family transcriptional regulator